MPVSTRRPPLPPLTDVLQLGHAGVAAKVEAGARQAAPPLLQVLPQRLPLRRQVGRRGGQQGGGVGWGASGAWETFAALHREASTGRLPASRGLGLAQALAQAPRPAPCSLATPT